MPSTLYPQNQHVPMEYTRHPERLWKQRLSAPIIYMAVFPVALLDLFMELYQHTCFPLYGIEKVKRKDYIKIDRHKLQYLNWLQKINCAYCGYVNGVLMYDKEIAGRTEAYWCSITHQKRAGFHAPPNHKDFIPYGDQKAFEKFKKLP